KRFVGPGATVPPSNEVVTSYTTRSYTGGVTAMFTNRLSNEFRINYTSNDALENSHLDTLGGSTPVDLQQMVGLGPDSQVGVVLDFAGTGPLMEQQTGTQRQWNLVNTLSYSVGHHQLKF